MQLQGHLHSLFCTYLLVLGTGSFAAVPESDVNYTQVLEKRVKADWYCSFPTPKAVLVGFLIGDDGKIYNVRVKQSSGDNQVDAECLEAVCGVSPVQLSPGRRITGDLTAVELTFHRDDSAEKAADNLAVVNYFKKHPNLQSKYVAIHLIPVDVLKRFPTAFSQDQIRSESNLRLIAIDGYPHKQGEEWLPSQPHSYSEIIKEVYARWALFFQCNHTPTRQDILKESNKIKRAALPAAISPAL